MNEILGFHRKLVKLQHKFFEEEEQAMVHVIPWVFQGCEGFKYLLIIAKQRRDRSDGPLLEVDTLGSVEVDIM